VNKHVGVNFDEMAAVPGTRLSFSLIERYKFRRLYWRGFNISLRRFRETSAAFRFAECSVRLENSLSVVVVSRSFPWHSRRWL